METENPKQTVRKEFGRNSDQYLNKIFKLKNTYRSKRKIKEP